MDIYTRNGKPVAIGLDFNPKYNYTSYNMATEQSNGVVPFGQAVNYEYTDEGVPIPDDSVNTAEGNYNGYSIKEWNTPTTEPSANVTACKIYGYIKELEVGEMAGLSALPFPYTRGDTFVFDWETSDPSVLTVKAGIVTALKAGAATVTAKLQGTTFTDSIKISVSTPKIQETNMLQIPANWTTEDGYALNSEFPATVLNVIKLAIQKAIDGGYDGVKFEKSIYNVRVYTVDDDKNFIKLDGIKNFTIDFSDSEMYMMDNGFCHCANNQVDKSTGYCLFKLINCEHVIIKNLNYYGERTYKDQLKFREAEYSEFTNFVVWKYNCTRCKLENINFYNTVGFNIATGSNLFQNPWVLGIIEDVEGAVQNGGHVQYYNLTSGHLKDDGTVENSSECIYTPDFITINISDENMPKFRMGTEMYTLYNSGISARWYDVFWYDSNKNLIAVQKMLHQYDVYDRPSGATFYKANFYQSNVPTENGENGYALTMFPAWIPNMCRITRCNFYNPHASALSITGGQRFMIDHCYMEQGKRYNWSVDYEDGWLEMRHNVIYRNICNGTWIIVEGNGNKICSNYIKTLQMNPYNESSAVINNHLKSWTKNDFAYGIDAYNWVGSEKVSDINTNTGFKQWERDSASYIYE